MLLAFSVGCKTSDSRGPASATKTAVDAARSAADLPLPDDPLLVAGIRPAKLDELVTRLDDPTGDVSARDWSKPETDSEADTAEQPSLTKSDDTRDYLASAFVARLMAGHHTVDTLVRRSDGQFRLEALDRDQPLYIVPSTSLHTDLLRYARFAAPLDNLDPPPSLVPVRLILPASRPEALAAEIDDHCNADDEDTWLGGQCKAVARTETEGNWVTVDLVFAPQESADIVDLHSELSDDEDGPYFGRVTPASVAFFEPDAAVTVHGRIENGWKLAVLANYLSEYDSDSSNRQGEEHVNILRNKSDDSLDSKLAQMARLAAPDSREYEDATLRLGVRPDGLDLELVRTYTTRGKTIAEATATPLELETVELADPLVEIEAAGQISDGFDTTGMPDWLEYVQHRQYKQLQRFNKFEAWGPLTSLVAYPTALLEQMAALRLEREPNLMDAFGRLTDLEGLRVAVDVKRDKQTELGATIRAAAVFQIPRSSNLDATVETVVDFLKTKGLSARFRTEQRGEQSLVVKATVGLEDSRFATIYGDPTPIEAGWTVDGHTERIVSRTGPGELLDGLEFGVLDGKRFNDQQLVYRHRYGTHATRTHLYLGYDRPPAAPDLPVDMTRLDSDTGPDCLTASIEVVRELSVHDAYAYRSTGRHELQSAADSLARHYRVCQQNAPQATDRLAWRYGIVLSRLAQKDEDEFFWSRATERYQKACRLGFEPACESTEHARKRARVHRLPEVDASGFSSWSYPDALLFADAEGLGSGDKRVAYSTSNFSRALSRLLAERALISEFSTSAHGRRRILTIVPDRGVPFDRLDAVVSTAREKFNGSGRHGLLFDGVAWFVHTDFEDEQQPGYLYTEFWSGDFEHPTIEESEALAVDIKTDGIDLFYAGNRLSPAEGCGEDGPTVCGDIDQFRRRLAAFKKSRPELDQAVFRPAPDVEYGRFARILAAATSAPSDDDLPARLTESVSERGALFPKKFLWVDDS